MHTAHDLRLTPHDSLRTTYDSRLTTYDSRLTTHGSVRANTHNKPATVTTDSNVETRIARDVLAASRR